MPGSFDDDAIRIDLRKIVKEAETRMLELLAAKQNEVRVEWDTVGMGYEDAEGELQSAFQSAESNVRITHQMMLDFIDRR